MPHIRADRIAENTSTTGTGALTLTGARSGGFRTFGSVMSNADTCDYCAVDATNNAWEVGIGTWNAGGTLSRTRVIASSNAGSLVNFAAAPVVFLTASSEEIKTPRVNIYTAASSTYTKPEWVSLVTVILVGGGAGGGSGRRGAAASQRNGGSGGGGGGYSFAQFPASLVPSSVTVTVGQSANGGAAIAVDSTNGSNGAAGNPTSFGTLMYALGGGVGIGGTATGTHAGGSGGSGTNGGNSGGTTGASGGAGGAGSTGGGWGASGGGAGGGLTTGNAASNGGAGGNLSGVAGNFSGAGAAGTTGAGQNGGNGTGVTANLPGGGAGGGGGASNASAAAGNGGNGGIYGGGGGGGGASVNGQTSGAGGTGAAGIAIVITE